MLVALDGQLIDVGGNDYVAQLTGFPGGDTGWVQVDLDLGTVTSGSHEVAIGGYVNGKLVSDDETDIYFDDVTLALTGTGNAPPQAVASATPLSGTAPLQVSFDSAGSSDADGYIASTSWEFGDGGTSIDPNPTHTYSSPGSYTATLSVVDDDGATATQSLTLEVSGSGGSTTILSSGFTGSAEGWTYADDEFRNTSAGSYVSGSYLSSGGFSGGGVRVRLGGVSSWPLQEGASGGWFHGFSLGAAAELTLSLRYRLDHQSDYSFELAQALVSLDGQLIGVSGNDYLAQLAGDPGGNTGWVQVDLDLGTVAAGSHELIIGGYVSQKVWADEPTDVFFDDLNLVAIGGNAPPVASVGASPSSGHAPLAVSFDGSGSSDSDGTIATYAWDFGDSSSGTGSTTSHTYASAGTYTATLVVTDDDGATDSASTTITVTAPNQAPTASASGDPASGPAPLAVNFTGSSSSDADGSIVAYAWDFGDGQASSAADPSHTYTSVGTYTATLTVTDDDGASASADVVVDVTAPSGAQAAFSATPTSGKAPLEHRSV